jgi:hypothetical protein
MSGRVTLVPQEAVENAQRQLGIAHCALNVPVAEAAWQPELADYGGFHDRHIGAQARLN